MGKCKDTKKLDKETNKSIMEDRKKTTSLQPSKSKWFTVMIIKDCVTIWWKTYKYWDKIKVQTIDWLIGLVTKIK